MPDGYASGAQLSFYSVWQNETFASLGIQHGIYDYGLTNGESIRLEATQTVSVEIRAQQVGNSVRISGSGALDLGAFGAPGGGTARAFVRADIPALGVGNAGGDPVDYYYNAFTTRPTFGPGLFSVLDSLADSGSGDKFGFIETTLLNGDKDPFFVPDGYASGDPLAFSSIWQNETFASLGIDPGIYLFGLTDGQTIALTIDDTLVPVPLPGTAVMLAVGLLGLGSLVRRDRAAGARQTAS